VAGALATLFAGAPAVGGKALSDSLDATFGLSNPAWQLLCTFAALCSLAAAISTQLLKSQNLEEHISKAENVRARLEIVDIGRVTGTLTPEQVAAEYTACVALVSFILCAPMCRRLTEVGCSHPKRGLRRKQNPRFRCCSG
jgi:hypothetical protein